MAQIRILPRIFSRGTRGIVLCGWFLCSLPLGAQTDVANFKVPDIDENGVMLSMLTGGSAKMFPQKPMQITKLRIDFFESDGKTVKMKIVSPFCNYDPRGGVATSEDRIRIDSPEFTITGKGYIFESGNSRIEIKNDVKVILRNLSLKTSKSPKESNDE